MAGSRPSRGSVGERLASRRRRRFVGRDAELELVRAALEGDRGDRGDRAVTVPEGRLVLLLDAYERLRGLDDWVRTWLLPRLPGSALTLIACRTPLDAAWRADPGTR
jgi:hypothetical protein